MNLKLELDLARRVAREAGALLNARGDEGDVVYKSSATDVATAVDHAAEALIVSAIQGAFPDDGVLAEESGSSAGNGVRRWIVDPLDGTSNYRRNLWPSVVSIALEVSGDLVLGVVFDHRLDDLYEATSNSGARLNGQPLAQPHVQSLRESYVGLCGSNRPGEIENRMRALNALVPACDSVRDMGSTALQLCLVARGLLDAHVVMDAKLWDVAGGFVIAREAGCDVVGFDRNCPTEHRAVAASPGITSELLTVLNA